MDQFLSLDEFHMGWNSVRYDRKDHFILPSSVWVVRGLREKFYEVNPFADNNNPTPAEIDSWNIEVILHIRALLGVTTPVQNDARLYLEARWASERKSSQAWDTLYPNGTIGTASGPCFLPDGTQVDNAGGHCGESFFPDEVDRLPYINAPPYLGNTTNYPELLNYNTRYSKASGLRSINADIPWSIKLAYVITIWICNEGLTGHAGPFVGNNARTRFGCAWFYKGVTGPFGNVSVGFRGKWAG